VLIVLGASVGRGAEEQIGIINARLGVAKAPRFKGECWAQLTVTIRNKGREANSEVQFTPLSVGFARSATFFRKQIVVPAQSEIEIAFPVLTQFDEKFLIELFVNGVEVDKQQFSASLVSISDPMALILDDGVTGYSYFKDMKIENRKLVLTIAQSRDLPEYWEVLSAINMTVLGDVDPRKFQQPQIDSLRSWVESGGILVVSTDERWERLRGSFLEDWLPVRMYGARPIDSIEPLGLRYGKPIEMHENLMMCESMPSSGRVLIKLQDLPLVAYRKMGLGVVVYSAVRLDSATLAHWAGLSSLWEEIFTLREHPIEVRRTVLETQREQMLSNITGLPVPTPQFVARLLVAYVAVVAIIFLLLRMRRKLEWAWCSLLVVAPVAAGIYHSIGQSTREEFKSTLNEISLVHMDAVPAPAKPGTSTGWIESFHSLYSDKEATYNIRAITADSLIAQGSMVAETSQAVVPSVNVMAEDTIVAQKMRVNEGGLQSFKSFSTRAFDGGVQSGLIWDVSGLRGEIRNDIGFPLQDAVVLFNRQLVPLKSIGAGESKLVQIADSKNARYEPIPSMGGAMLDVTRKRILENLFSPQGNYNPAQDEPLLIGWGEQPVSQITDEEGKLARKGLVLYVIALPYKKGEGDILIPKGVCLVRVSSALSFQKGKWVQMQGFASGSEIDVDYRIPPEVRDVAVETIRGHFEIENPGGDMATSVSAFDWTSGKWTPIGRERDFTLNEPWRYVLQPIGRVRLKLTVTAIRTKIPVGDTPSLRAFKWRVQDVDIEIKGKLS
jgi:hypothetical protein